MAIAKIQCKKNVYLRGKFFAEKCSDSEFAEFSAKMESEYNLVGEFTHGMKQKPPGARAYARRLA
jgi:hypothetical protein